MNVIKKYSAAFLPGFIHVTRIMISMDIDQRCRTRKRTHIIRKMSKHLPRGMRGAYEMEKSK